MRLAAGNVRNCATHAAATVVIASLETVVSPPFQREGKRKLSELSCVPFSLSFLRPSTHLAVSEISHRDGSAPTT